MSGKEEPVSKETETLTKYANYLFEHSLVNGFPQIVQTHSNYRKIYKIFVLIVCFVGFVYQTTQFMNIVLTYPSVVDIYVEYPESVLAPAVTFCDSNSIMRSKFCDKYPDDCETPQNMTNFCNLYPYYCVDNVTDEDFKIPKTEIYDFEEEITIEDVKELGHDPKIFVAESRFTSIYTDEDIAGPLLYPKEKSQFQSKLSACYSFGSRVESSSEPIMVSTNIFNDQVMHFTFYFESEEYFRPDRRVGGILAIHSPFVAVNPYTDGFQIRPGRDYKAHVIMTEDHLLPHPYTSDCINYTEIWINNEKKGPRSRQMCAHGCVFNFTVTYCNCTLLNINYPHQVSFCGENLTGECSVAFDHLDEVESCVEECKEDCRSHKFRYDFQERSREKADVKVIEEMQIRRRSNVDVFIKDPEVVTFKYRPQYQDIEVFSYLGGYIGAWLGISLVAVLDFFETLVLMIRFCFRKTSKKQDQINAT